jgi:hypothetical protein
MGYEWQRKDVSRGKTKNLCAGKLVEERRKSGLYEAGSYEFYG